MSLFFSGRTLVAIDGSNFHGTARTIGLDVDYSKLLALFSTQTDMLRTIYYTAIDEAPVGQGIKPLCDFLEYNGYTVVSKSAKSYGQSDGSRRLKGNMDIELTVDALEMSPHYENLVLVSGDGDFTYLVRSLQRRGKRITVLSASNSQVLSDDLKRAADRFIDLTDMEIQKMIKRERKPAVVA